MQETNRRARHDETARGPRHDQCRICRAIIPLRQCHFRRGGIRGGMICNSAAMHRAGLLRRTISCRDILPLAGDSAAERKSLRAAYATFVAAGAGDTPITRHNEAGMRPAPPGAACASAEVQLLEEVIALVVDDDEGGEVLDLDLPDRLHAELGIFLHLDLLDAVLR